MLLKLQKYNLQVQYKRGAEMHIANFLSRTFTDRKGEEQKQQQNASKGQADDIDILAIEDKSYWPTICANSRAHKTRQSTASPESDNFRWSTSMYQRILVMQRQTGSSQWGYLQKKWQCHHSKSIATKNANKNTCKPPWSRNMFT